MKKILLTLFVFLVAASIQLFAQEKVVTGKVTSYTDGTPIPGVSVVIKGTTKGTVTDVNGVYKLSVPEDAIIVFSFVGMTKEEVDVKGKSTFDLAMTEDIAKLSEVVVTALGISREKKSLGYSVQDLKGDDLVQSRENNVINSLSGKIAGVQIIGNTGSMGGSSRITLRGINSVTGNNQPLFVIDGVPIDNSDYNTQIVDGNINTNNTARGAGGYDFGNMASDINPDDIASVSVLKGPNAAALYGSRAANGVIIITTKKGIIGKGKPGIGVKINSGISLEQVSVLPNYQNSYGGGSILAGNNGFDQVTINGVEYNVIDYATDESFGPKYDPNIQYLPAWSIFDWEAAGKPNTPLQTVPWTKSDNDVKSFFETGVTYNNNFELVGGSDISAFRLSYTNTNSKGYMPNSTLKRNTINLSGNTKLGKKINTFGVITYTNTKALGRPSTGYDDNNVMQKFNQWGQRQLDMSKLENYENPDGTQRVWNRVSWDDPTPNYSDNPYWTRNKNYQNDDKDNYVGSVGLTWDILDWLKVTGKLNSQYYELRIQERVAVGSQALSLYAETIRDYWEVDKEILFQIDKNLSDAFRLGATFGGNRMDRTTHYNEGITSGGLQIRDYYNLRNSGSTAISFDQTFNKKVNSLYGSASLSYYSLLYLDLTMRNDWSSTLPKENNSYLYPSVQLSFVFTELNALKDNKILSFGKVRAGWAQVGNDTDPYNLITPYTAFSNFGSEIRYTRPATLNNPELKPEEITSIETGTELKFLNNRAGIDFTYYTKTTRDLIIPIPISGATGYTFKYVNAGELNNKGIEFMINLVPIKKTNFQWDIFYNFSRNRNEVVSLAPGIEAYQLANAPFKVSVNAKVGEPYGAIMGTDFVYDNNGNKLINPATGRYLVSEVKVIGNIMPKYNMGISNNFKYKNIDFGFLIDYQKGGQLFSTTNMWGMYSGILEESAATNDKGINIREEVANGGGVKNEGVYGTYVNGVWHYTDANGNPSDVPVTNTTYIEGQQYCHDFYDGPISQNIFNTDYIKLREVRIGYTLPAKISDKIKIKNLKVSAFGRNLAIWGKDCPHIDPENTTSSGNIQGLEGGALPSLRTFGFNLSFDF